MDYFYTYIIRNFILLAVVIVMAIHSFQHYKEHKRVSLCIMSIMAVTLLISVLEVLEDVAKDSSNIMGATVTSCLMYILRPSCIVLFVLLSGQNIKHKFFPLFLIPLGLCLIVYILPLIPATREWVFWFAPNDLGSISFHAADNPLRFTSHLVSLVYLGFLLYRSFTKLKFKHFTHAMTLLICAVVVICAVLIETFWNADGSLHILNTSIAVSTVFYYLFLYIELSKFDALTGLFNRKAYYADLPKMDKSITGVMQIDMNGLKYLNDVFGHKEGDKGLQAIAKAIIKATNYKMYAYRLGGDEFIILDVNDTEERLIEAASSIKQSLEGTPYSVSIGYAIRNEHNRTTDDLYHVSEMAMYKDKEEFYKTAKFERRRLDSH